MCLNLNGKDGDLRDATRDFKRIVWKYQGSRKPVGLKLVKLTKERGIQAYSNVLLFVELVIVIT